MNPPSAARRRGSLLQTIKAVAWSFLGVRKSADYEKDVERLNPVHVIIAGVIGAILFIVVLVLLVNWVLSSGVAQAAQIAGASANATQAAIQESSSRLG